MRISLRELMLVVAVTAVGLVALRFPASPMLPIVQAIVGALFLSSLVRAVVDRGPRRAFAVGFLIWAAGYAAAAQWSDRIDWLEASSIETTFQPTKWLVALGRYHQWVDLSTGQPLNFDPTQPAADSHRAAPVDAAAEKDSKASPDANLLGPVQIQYLPPSDTVVLGGYGRPAYVDSSFELLLKKTFSEEQIANAMLSAANNKTQYGYQWVRWPIKSVLVGHCLGMLVAGFCGGHFATYIRDRRSQRAQSANRP